MARTDAAKKPRIKLAQNAIANKSELILFGTRQISCDMIFRKRMQSFSLSLQGSAETREEKKNEIETFTFISK